MLSPPLHGQCSTPCLQLYCLLAFDSKLHNWTMQKVNYIVAKQLCLQDVVVKHHVSSWLQL